MSEELESRLRRDLAGLDDVDVADRSQLRAAGARLDARRSARRRTTMLVSCVALLVVAGGSVWWASSRPIESTSAERTLDQPPSSIVTAPLGTTGDEPPPVATELPATTFVIQPNSEPHGSWRPIAADPNVNGNVFAAAWTGSEAIVLSGVAVGNTTDQIHASAYDPIAATWRTLAPPVVDGPRAPFTVWTGDEMLFVASGYEQVGQASVWADRSQAYDPDTDSWRPIAVAPYPLWSGTPSAWTGDELFVLAFGDGSPEISGSPIAYSPDTDSWRQLAAPPIVVRSEAASVWTGTEWIIWGGASGSDHFSDGAAYNPATDSWRVIADSPLSARKAPGVWTGSELLVDAGRTGDDSMPMALADGAAYDPATDTWRWIAYGPAHPGFEPLFTGRYLLQFAKGFVEVYDVESNTWIDTCCAEGGASGVPVWTGSEALVFSEFGGAAFTPPP